MNLEQRTTEQLKRIATKKNISSNFLLSMYDAVRDIYAEMENAKQNPSKYARKQIAYYLSWRVKK